VQATKNKFREVLRKHSVALGEVEHLEFLLSADRSEITVFEIQKPTRKQGRREELAFQLN
jgi:hypothetical protein